MPKSSVLAALESLTPNMNTSIHKVVVMFGDQPDVLEAIRQARLRKCSYSQIAKALSSPDASISEAAIRSWLASQGID